MEILQLSYRDGQTTIVWRQENTTLYHPIFRVRK